LAAEAGEAGTTTAEGTWYRLGEINKVAGTCGGTGRKSGPFCPQPDSTATAVTLAIRPYLLVRAESRPKIRDEKTITGL